MSKIEVFIDGTSKGNPGISAYGVVIYKDKQIIKQFGNNLGIMTANCAEYYGLIFALIEVLEWKNEEIEIKSDSQLLVKQVNGEYKVKDEKIKNLFCIVNFLLKKYNKVKIVNIPRKENKIADKIASSYLSDSGDKKSYNLFKR